MLRWKDRSSGAVFGAALGDALGLPAEGGDKAILAEQFPSGLDLPHKRPTREFPLNDWTDDTDFTVLVMRAMAQRERPAEIALAEGILRWHTGGFPELGDTSCAGCGNMIWRVLRRPEFAADPFGAAEAAIGPKAGNGALMRTAPCAFAERSERSEYDRDTRSEYGWASRMCRVTHSDARCVASCVAQCVMLRELATADRADPDTVRRAIDTAAPTGPVRAEMIAWAARSARLADLDLGNRESRGYTFRTLGCAFWAFRQLLRCRDWGPALFKRCMVELVMEGGDADTNAAVAGAVFGAALGYDRLPRDWIDATRHRDWLASEIAAWQAVVLSAEEETAKIVAEPTKTVAELLMPGPLDLGALFDSRQAREYPSVRD
jgi:ADP-ribosylglycohydrolase